MDFILIWILFGIVTAVIASHKGRNGFGWFLIGVLLGPIGLILALVASKNQPKIDEQILQSGEMKKCPYCAELIKKEAIVCRYCGKDVPIRIIYDCVVEKAGVVETRQAKLLPNETEANIKAYFTEKGYKVLACKQVGKE